MKNERKEMMKQVAAERMAKLFQIARSEAGRDAALSKEHVRELIKISTHYKVPLTQEMKRGICKECSSILIPGKNAEFRVTSKGYVARKCLACGSEIHIFFKSKKK